MDQKETCVTFTKKKGCFIKRSVCILLGIVFVCAVVATGLLVYYYTPIIRGDSIGSDCENETHTHDDGSRQHGHETHSQTPTQRTTSFSPAVTQQVSFFGNQSVRNKIYLSKISNFHLCKILYI